MCLFGVSLIRSCFFFLFFFATRPPSVRSIPADFTERCAVNQARQSLCGPHGLQTCRRFLKMAYFTKRNVNCFISFYNFLQTYTYLCWVVVSFCNWSKLFWGLLWKLQKAKKKKIWTRIENIRQRNLCKSSEKQSIRQAFPASFNSERW